MSLIKLLSVSQSFERTKTDPDRYKIQQQYLLPKFAPANRPISLAPQPLFEGRRVPSGLDHTTVPVSSTADTLAEKIRLSAMNNPFHRQANSRDQAQLVEEPAIEKVRVVRNDLNETDLEVVRAVSTPSRSPEARKPEPQRRGKGSGLIWNQLTTRLMSVARSIF